MGKDSSCFYCMKDKRLDDLMVEIAPLQVSTLFLFKEQTYHGRCLVAYRDHVKELFELDDEQLHLFMQDVKRAAAAMQKAFSPAKINYGAFSDKLAHLHFHLVPKYEGGPDWGGTFRMNPQQTYLSDTEYKELANAVRRSL